MTSGQYIRRRVAAAVLTGLAMIAIHYLLRLWHASAWSLPWWHA